VTPRLEDNNSLDFALLCGCCLIALSPQDLVSIFRGDEGKLFLCSSAICHSGEILR
jgi:hypothetical protein